MATYVTSDAHGHLRALDRALELAQPGAGDTVFVLGDMVDRGPDPVGVMRLVRGMENAVVLAGNHEAMMLETIAAGDESAMMSWHINGGYITSEQLDELPGGEASELLDWVASLPTFAVVEVPDGRSIAARGERRAYILCHAGIDAARLRTFLGDAGVGPDRLGGYGHASVEQITEAMRRQLPDDLLWIRREFWGEPTGLVGRDGRGPVVVAGHTPSIAMRRYSRLMCGRGASEDDLGVMVEVGPSRDTGGTADRLCVDCSAAVGHPHGRVGVMRLEDRKIWYARIEEGE